MTVRNGAPYLREAIDSVLAQTDSNFELVVVDDGSTDATPDILATYRDARVVVHKAAAIGRVAALKKAMEIARGTLIAILDADDIALPDRLATQRRFLEENRDVALVGCMAIEFDNRKEWQREPVTGRAQVRRALAMYNPYYHSSIMFRRSAYDAVGGYRPDGGWGHDKDLLVRFAKSYPVDIIDTPLIRYRNHAANWSRRREDESSRLRKSTSLQLNAARELGLRPLLWIYPLSAWLYARVPSFARPRRLKHVAKRALLRLLRTVA